MKNKELVIKLHIKMNEYLSNLIIVLKQYYTIKPKKEQL